MGPPITFIRQLSQDLEHQPGDSRRFITIATETLHHQQPLRPFLKAIQTQVTHLAIKATH